MKAQRALLVLTIAFVLTRATNGADYTIKAGSTDVSVYFVINSPSGTPTAVAYTRSNQALATLTPSTALASATTVHTDNKWFIVDQDASGLNLSVVRYDLPDAVCASGASSVVVRMTDDNPSITTLRIDLVGYDPTAAALAANVTQFGGANGTFSSGRPEVNVKLVEGVDATDAIATPALLFNEAIAGTTVEENNVWSFTSNAANLGVRAGHMAIVYDASAANRPSVHYVTNVSGVNVTLDRVPDFMAEEGDLVKIFATPGQLKEILEDTGTTLDDLLDTEINAIKTKTDFLPSATAGSTGGLFIAGTNATTSITGGLTANITGNLSGSVGSVTGNVGGNVIGSVGSISGLTITGGRVNADVTHWLGTAPTSTVPGVPQVDITHVLGSPVCD